LVEIDDGVLFLINHQNNKPMDVLIFKTSVATPGQANRLQPLLSALSDIKQYTFDLEDCDRVLRIVSSRIEPQTIKHILRMAGFSCEELQ
jgi:hypothetical protein